MSPAFPQQPATILVAAAADMARTQAELSESFAKVTGYHVRFTTGSSGMLARQIEQGAPFDVYLSANEAFVRQLETAGQLVPGSVREYARGRLALWSRRGTIRSVEDLPSAQVRHIAIANPQHAPYGVAAREALKSRGLWDRLAGKIVYGENVRQALQFAETGNADAFIGAWSLVFDRGAVLLPGNWHAPIRQVGAALKGSRQPRAAAAFLNFLAGPAGKRILQRYGFD